MKQKKTSAKRKAGIRGRAAEKREPLLDFIEHGTRSLGLKIDKAWVPGIATHLSVALRHGALVERFALPDETDLAPVFEP